MPPSASPPADAVPLRDAPLASAHPLTLLAGFSAISAVAAAGIRVDTDFDHGIWLVAYLLLVGCLAPALLGLGERHLLLAPRAGQGARWAAALWLAGVTAVPAGVLGNVRLLVCIGAACLVLSLLLLARRAFAGGAPPRPGRSGIELAAHALTIVVMAVSTGIGVLLAWDYPWF